tara:strand:+ start:4338 stop:4868 length:531 start_codon:yes stop_codon:yes gene_type:complete
MNRVLTAQTVSAISNAVSRSITADKAGVKALDALIADGFDRITDFISPKSADSTATAEEFEALNAAIVMGFSADIQRLLLKPVKGLSDEQKTTRRYWQQQIGARRNDFKRQLGKRLEPFSDLIAEADAAKSRNRTLDQRVRDNLNDVIKVCQKAEEANFDVPDMIARVKAALEILK